jgi:hypothetical protein
MSMLLAFLLVSGQAQATQPTPPPSPPAAAPQKAERKVCREQEAESGSHMAKRVCLTAREWQLVDDGVNLSDKTIQTSAPQ